MPWKGPNRDVVPESDDAPEIGNILVQSEGSFVIPGDYLVGNDDTILQREGNQDLKLYDSLLDDDVAFSTFQQRRLAVISKEWEVKPGDEDDPRSVEAADHLRKQLKGIEFDRISNNMLFGIWFGYAVGEVLYKIGNDGKIWIDDIVVPDRRWFGFTSKGELRFKNFVGNSFGGQVVPANKFWVMRTGASHDFAFYGLGLAHWCYWPIWFKRNITKFWALYLEKLGYPTVVGEQDDNWTDGEKTSFLKALIRIGKDRAVKVPKGSLDGITLMEAKRSGAGTSSYKDFTTEQNEALMRVVLGQPGTSKATPGGIGTGQADSHDDVKKEIVKADADLSSASFNRTISKWVTKWNFGEDVAPPLVYRVLDDCEDLNLAAERDEKLHRIGIRRTKEGIEETYGAGYEQFEPPKEEAPPIQMIDGKPVANLTPANDDEEQRLAEFAARDVSPLYVYRKLKNVREVRAWAKSQGLKLLVPANQMHVTCLYSKTPVDWFDVADLWGWNEELTISAGGPRKVEALGDEGAIVLRFASEDLIWQHKRKIEKGASHDYDEFLPHLTLTYDAGEVDLDQVEPYNGRLVFGPEIFEEIKTSFDPADLGFSAGDEDAIDRLAQALAEETNPVFVAMGEALRDNLEGASSPEAVRVALLEAFEALPHDQMAALAGLPMIAVRMAAEAGADDEIVS